jgi:drug/metabolite transporter (DMT)-like permease
MAFAEHLAVTFALAAAAAWGAGDFSGGLATRRTSALTVVLVSQLVGGLLLAGLALILDAPRPSAGSLALASGAGLAGACGLLALYRGLARGPMGLVAPVAAVVSAVLPILAAARLEGAPSRMQAAGFAMGLAAVWALSRPGGASGLKPAGLGLPIAAGVCFGVFLILIDRVSDEAVLWPLAMARAASVTLLLGAATMRRDPRSRLRGNLKAIVLAGIGDTAGNALFALAARHGRLDIATVLSGLYPGATVLLARGILKERLRPSQWTGVLAALAATALLAIG